jgi:hypothetical protein
MLLRLRGVLQMEVEIRWRQESIWEFHCDGVYGVYRPKPDRETMDMECSRKAFIDILGVRSFCKVRSIWIRYFQRITNTQIYVTMD